MSDRLPVNSAPSIAMTIKLTEAEFEEQLHAAGQKELQFDPFDKQDITWKHSARIAQGWLREIWLREGIYLKVEQCQHIDYVTISRPLDKQLHSVGCRFLLSGNTQVRTAYALGESLLSHSTGQYHIISSGTEGLCFEDYDIDFSLVQFALHPKILHSFATSLQGELPKQLQHLIRPMEQNITRQARYIHPKMSMVLQQILHCPYRGMVKRAYLESKVIELAALVLDHEVTIQQGEAKKSFLKPEQIERVYYAKEILLRDLDNPPSLEELARQVGLNDFLLKQGFHQVFGTTVFGELRSHRLEIAKQLLAEQDISVAEIAEKVGYGSSRALARAFKNKFGISPKSYQKACR